LRQVAPGIARLGREDAVIAVVVQVDESRTNHQAFAIDRLSCAADFQFSNTHDPVAAHRHIALVRLAAGTIDDGTAAQHDIHVIDCLGMKRPRSREAKYSRDQKYSRYNHVFNY
jgi:hypothetical protein